MRGPETIDAVIAGLADGQHGVVARWQVTGLGYSEDALDRRLSARRLRRLHRGVYAVGHRALRPQAHWLAAVLALGPEEAFLSYASAAALWGIRPSAAAAIDVTLPTSTRRRCPGVRVHRHAALNSWETTMRDGIPATTPARTLLDLAATLPRTAVSRAVDEAERKRLLDARDLRRVLAAHGGRAGARRLGDLLAEWDGAAPTRSQLEADFLALCAAHGLPRPAVNTYVCGLEVDFHWPERRLVVEVDGYAYHGTRRAFERDRERDAILAAAGIRVQRFSHRQVTARPKEVVRAMSMVS